MFKKLNVSLIEILFVVLFIALFVVFQWNRQPLVDVNHGLGWDGAEYAKIYDNFKNQTHDKVIFPFCNRILTPYLAFLIQLPSPIFAFKIINIFFSFGFSILIYLISRKVGFNKLYAFVALLLTMILYFSPSKFLFFYPVYTDPGFLFLLSLSFLSLVCRNYFLSIVFLIIAYPIREASIYLLPLFLIFFIILEKFKWRFVAYFIFGILTCLILKAQIVLRFGCHGNQLLTALWNGFYKLNHPSGFIKCFAGILMTIGPLIYCDFEQHDLKIEKISLIGLIYSILLAIIGGGDTTRILYSFFPIYFILIISCMQKKGISYSLFSVMAYCCTNQTLVKIQQPLNSWPTRDEYIGYFNQFPDYAPLTACICIILTWYIVLYYSRYIGGLGLFYSQFSQKDKLELRLFLKK